MGIMVNGKLDLEIDPIPFTFCTFESTLERSSPKLVPR